MKPSPKPRQPALRTTPRKHSPKWLRCRIREISDWWGVHPNTVRDWVRRYGAHAIRYDLALAQLHLRNPNHRWNSNTYLAAKRIVSGWHAGLEYLRRLDAQKLSTAETKTTETSK